MAKSTLNKIGIVAGSGKLPSLLAKSCIQKGHEYKVLAINNFFEESISGVVADLKIDIGQIGKAIKYFKEENIKEIILVGGIKKPKIFSFFPDFKTFKILFKLGFLRYKDNKLITSLIEVIQEEGFIVTGAKNFLPELIAPEGIIGSIKINKEDSSEVDSAFLAARDFGLKDIGQAVVWRKGRLIATEDINGTDYMLSKISLKNINAKPSGFLVKVLKPGQEIRIDMPTIGPDTIRMVRAAGLEGIVVHANYTLIVEIKKTINLANELGVFLFGYKYE